MTIRYALKQYGRKMKRNGIAFAAVAVVFAACAAPATARTLDVTAYGAKPDGVTDNTAAIQKAIDECSAKGGGRVLVPGGGAYMTYTLSLKNNVDLHIDRGATLLGGEDPLKYPLFGHSEHWNAERALRFNYRAMFYTVAQTNVSISGAGTIDGNNEKFHHWEPKKNWTGYNWWRNSHTNVTGRCVFFVACRDVRLDDVLIRNPGGWANWFLDCDRVGVRGARIECDHRFPNGDGLHFGGCRDVVVSDCVVDSQDDALVIRCHQEQMKKSRPCERVLVNNCVLRSARCYAIRMGWRGDGPMKDISLSNIICPHYRWGVGFFYPDETTDWAKHKDPPRGQGLVPPPPETLIPFYMKNVRFSNVHITCEDEPIWLKVDNGTPFQYMRDISFSDCSFRSGVPPHIECCAKYRRRFSNWRFSNVTFDFRRMKWAKKPTASDIFRAVDGFEFINTRFSLHAKPAK